MVMLPIGMLALCNWALAAVSPEHVDQSTLSRTF